MIQLSQEKGFPGWMLAGTYCLGEAYALLGRSQEGIDLIKEGVKGELASGVKVSISGPLGYLAEVYARLGEVEKGLAVWNELNQLIEATGERHWETEHYRVLSLLQLAQGDEVGAEASLKRALEISRRQHARSWELRAAVDLAQLWQKQGRIAESREVVKPIYDWFTEGFDTPDMQEARKYL